jgi:hypothetical protein
VKQYDQGQTTLSSGQVQAGFGIQEFPDGIDVQHIACQGNSAATAAVMASSPLTKRKIYAQYVDASNFAIGLNSAGGPLSIVEIMIIASGPTGTAITVFPYDVSQTPTTFSTGETSVSIPVGKGKIFTSSDGLTTDAWAYIG